MKESIIGSEHARSVFSKILMNSILMTDLQWEPANQVGEINQ